MYDGAGEILLNIDKPIFYQASSYGGALGFDISDVFEPFGAKEFLDHIVRRETNDGVF